MAFSFNLQPRSETGTPPWDRACTCDLLLTLGFYGPLWAVVHAFPALASPGLRRPCGELERVAFAPAAFYVVG